MIVRVLPVSTLRTWTVTPGRTALDSSVIVPEMVPVVACAPASAGTISARSQTPRDAHKCTRIAILPLVLPFARRRVYGFDWPVKDEVPRIAGVSPPDTSNRITRNRIDNEPRANRGCPRHDRHDCRARRRRGGDRVRALDARRRRRGCGARRRPLRAGAGELCRGRSALRSIRRRQTALRVRLPPRDGESALGAAPPRAVRRDDRRRDPRAGRRAAALLVGRRILRKRARRREAGPAARLVQSRGRGIPPRGRSHARRLGHEVRLRARHAARRGASKATADPAETIDAVAASTAEARRQTGQARRMTTTLNAELAETAERLVSLCGFCGFCVDRRP